MRKISATVGHLLLLFITLTAGQVIARNPSRNIPDSSSKVALKDGDRVVFLGNSLFENDFQYAYLELALTTRFPDLDLTFRNLGWSGDNVWGDARSTYTNPPTAYQHLMRNIADTKPTVVLLGYGGIEAQEGAAGLPHFKDGLNKLLDKIDSLGAKTILLSPIPVISTDTTINLSKRNSDIELYAAAIAAIASERNRPFIDLYKPIKEISKKESLIENGVHLNETGYYYLAETLEKSLGLKQGQETATINYDKTATNASANTKILSMENNDITFEIHEDYLPIPLPLQNTWIVDNERIIRINGLKKGFYSLTADNKEVISASAKEWEKGMEIKQGPSFRQADELREMILKKNDIHFFQYRPMNETYIIGFRSYEQGRHVKGLEAQNLLITWLEGQIALHKKPKPHVYKLSQLK